MEKLFSQIVGSPVVEEDSGRPFTAVRDLLVDPDRGDVVAVEVNYGRNMVIAPVDILKWTAMIRVQGPEVITEADEIIRAAEVLQRNVQFVGAKVISEDGRFIGRTYDYSVDVAAMKLRSLLCAKGWLGLFRYDNRVISVKMILEVMPGLVVVKNDLGEVGIKQEDGKVELAEA